MSKTKETFNRIYGENVDKIYRFVYFKVSSADIAEDISSEVFLRCWQVLNGDRTEIENPQAFLYQVARNLVVDHYREKARTQIVSTESLPLSDPAENLQEALFLNSDISLLEKALSGLNSQYQEVLVWRYIEDYSISEMAKMLSLSEGAVRIKIHRALKSLKKSMGEKFAVETS